MSVVESNTIDLVFCQGFCDDLTSIDISFRGRSLYPTISQYDTHPIYRHLQLVFPRAPRTSDVGLASPKALGPSLDVVSTAPSSTAPAQLALCALRLERLGLVGTFLSFAITC